MRCTPGSRGDFVKLKLRGMVGDKCGWEDMSGLVGDLGGLASLSLRPSSLCSDARVRMDVSEDVVVAVTFEWLEVRDSEEGVLPLESAIAAEAEEWPSESFKGVESSAGEEEAPPVWFVTAVVVPMAL